MKINPFPPRMAKTALCYFILCLTPDYSTYQGLSDHLSFLILPFPARPKLSPFVKGEPLGGKGLKY